MITTKLNRITQGIKVACLVTLGSLSSLPTHAQEANDDEVEVIEVRGLRASTKENLNRKRFSNVVADIITAEDIGKFPDKNVADTLARVPGVTIDRDFGEGDGVTIRGFSPEQNITLLNGQAVGTAQWFILRNTGRNFNYELLSSELISGVEVYKSTQADIEEGGLGGTVNVTTRKPLDLDSGTIFLSAEAQYSDIPDSVDPGFAGIYSWKDEDEKFGFIVSASVQEREVQRESQESDFGHFGPGIARIAPGLSAPSTNGVGNPGPEAGSLPWGVGSAVFFQDRKRTGFDTTLQYSPRDDISMSLHYLYSELEADNVNSNLIGIPFRFLFNGPEVAREGTVENGFVTSLNGTGVPGGAFNARFLAYDNIFRNGSSAETEVLDFELDWSLENSQFHLQIGTTTGEGQINDFFTEFFNDATDPRTGLIFSNPNPSQHGPSIDFVAANPWLQNPGDEFRLLGLFDQSNTTEDEEDYIQADWSFNVELGPVTDIKVGGKFKDRKFSQDRFRDDIAGGDLGPASLFFDGDFIDADHSENSLPAQRYFFPDVNLIRSAFDALPDCGAGVTGTCRNNNVRQLISVFEIEEEITALYAMAHFSGDGFRGNLGVRYTDTDSTSSGFNGANPVQFDNSYDEFLPSFNISYDLTDNLVLRGAAGRTLTRPTPFNLAPSFNLTPETGRGDAGNPDLEPTLSTAFDIGLEWYFDEASIASLTFFRKDLSNFVFINTVQEVVDGVNFPQLRRPENGGNAEVEGIEFQFAHTFDSGFGGFLNYTYVNSPGGVVPRLESVPAVVDDDGNEIQPSDVALVNELIRFPNVSENAFNIGAFYENETISARIAWTWRDEYFQSQTEFGPQFRDDYGQLDAQVSYNLNEHVTLKLQAINLTDEVFNNFLIQDGDVELPTDGSRIVSTEAQNGRRFYVGANFRF
ncbi:TonB-dependent receptor [Alteromonadaceae bacterium M269]|nr:TonB-dependent receptor [Alteromonadaceae bacterium M269]